MVTPSAPLPGLSKGQAALLGDGSAAAAAAPPSIVPRGAAASAQPVARKPSRKPMSKGQADLMGDLPAEVEDDTYGVMTHGVAAGADADDVEPGEYRNIDMDEPDEYRNIDTDKPDTYRNVDGVEGEADSALRAAQTDYGRSPTTEEEEAGTYSNIELDSNGAPIQLANDDDVYDSMTH